MYSCTGKSDVLLLHAIPGRLFSTSRTAPALHVLFLKQMCGIGGFQINNSAGGRRISGSPGLGEYLLSTMQKKLRHRGPDGQGCITSCDGTVGFCHTRLAIVDLSANGSQPMATTDGQFAITFNGEIYNWQELRKELVQRGVSFQSHSDTEVILAGYREWGYDVLQKLRGMYAFALWDEQDKSLFCARDQVGKKPFIHGESPKGFFFASEIPPLLAISQTAGIDTGLDGTGLANMLLHNLRHIPEPCTAYKGLRKLRPGHALVVKDGRVRRMWRHWLPKSRKVDTPQQLRAILEEAVAVRSIADVPVGALLSGGVDSSAIVNLMQRQSNEPVRTYAFGADKDDEDLRRARIMANQLGTQHKEFYFDPDRQFEIFRRMLATYGEPIMLLPLIHAYEISEAIHDDGIKVVLNGNGADELFYGYTGHLRTARVTRLMNMFGWIRHIIPETKHSELSVFMAPPGKRKAMFYRRKAEERWPKLFQDDVVSTLEHVVSKEMEAWGQLLPNHDFIDESNYLSLLIENTHSLTIASDLPAMMASVEMRSPFLDEEVISAAMGIHFSKKVKGPKDGSQLKNILRKAVADLVPQELLYAPKRGFGMGVQEKDVLLGPWRAHADEVFNAYPDLGFFDTSKVKAMWTNAKRMGSGQWDLLAKLLAIGVWLDGVHR